MMGGRTPDRYGEAMVPDGETHPIDEEVERCVRHGALRKRILAAQDRVMAALGDQRHLYLELEQLVGDRAYDRERAMFNIGFEHGLVHGSADSLRRVLPRHNREARRLAKHIARLAARERLEPVRALNIILEVAWLTIGATDADARARAARGRESR
jgi:hypothetical protein